jgi:hypothetical protein
MTTRTFLQQGQGYGSSPATVTVLVNGSEVFNGPVPTVDQPVPTAPNSVGVSDANLFTWTNTVDFTGTQSFELTVNSGTVLLTDSYANYGFTDNPTPPTDNYPGGADAYQEFFQIDIGGTIYTDPFSGVAIDGVAQNPDRNGQDGQWYWTIPTGSTFTATLNVQAGTEAQNWDSGTAYPWFSFVTNNGAVYMSYKQTGTTAGIAVTDTTHWLPVPSPQWNVGENYTAGVIVSNSGTAYRALQNVTPGTDILNATFWGKCYIGWKP